MKRVVDSETTSHDRLWIVGRFQEQISRRKGSLDREGVITTIHPWECHLIKQNAGNGSSHILLFRVVHYLCLTVVSLSVSLTPHGAALAGPQT